MLAIANGNVIEFDLEVKNQFVLQKLRMKLIKECLEEIIADRVVNSAMKQLVKSNTELIQTITAILNDQEEIKMAYQSFGPDFIKLITTPVTMDFIGLTYMNSQSEDLFDVINSVIPQIKRIIIPPTNIEDCYHYCLQQMFGKPTKKNMASFFKDFLVMHDEAEANAKVFGLTRK